MSDAAVLEEQKLAAPTVVCYRLLDRHSKALPSFEYDAEALGRLVLEAARPVIGELTPANHQRLLDVSVSFYPERAGGC